ncbi:hypothetical protein KY347_01355 [Candidatus Woesearchaeota archaeon]|nr:hypothetical protein [Candidatus Woesearchaeota archaeon]
MKIITYFILALVMVNLVFLIGCSSADKSSQPQGEDGDIQAEYEDTGIGDIFEDTEEVNPPQIPA